MCAISRAYDQRAPVWGGGGLQSTEHDGPDFPTAERPSLAAHFR